MSGLFERFWSVAGAVSIRTKVLGIVLGTLILLGIFVTIQVRWSLTRILRQQLEKQGFSITSHVTERAANLINGGESDSLDILVQQTQLHYSDPQHNTEIKYLFIMTPQGQVLADTLPDRVPDKVVRANLLSSGEANSQVWRSVGKGRVLDIAERFPLANGQTAIVRLGLSDHEIAHAVSGVTRQLLITSGLMSLVGIAAAVFLTWIITRPIRNLVQATQAVASGDLTQRVRPWANDEIGRLAEAFNAMTGTLAQAAKEQAERHTLRAQFVSRVITAQEEERRRIARELHDSTSQSLTSLLVGLQALEETGDADVRQRTEDLRQIVGKTLEEVHGLAWQLRPSALDDLGLTAALERYVADFQERYQLPVDITIHGMEHGRLSPEVETTIYRIVQEALTNVARHAHASRASVMIEQRGGKTLVIVEDNGIGLDQKAVAQASREHLGLYGIRERAELLGGKLTIEAEHGTSLFVELPGLHKERHDGSTESNRNHQHFAG